MTPTKQKKEEKKLKNMLKELKDKCSIYLQHETEIDKYILNTWFLSVWKIQNPNQITNTTITKLLNYIPKDKINLLLQQVASLPQHTNIKNRIRTESDYDSSLLVHLVFYKETQLEFKKLIKLHIITPAEYIKNENIKNLINIIEKIKIYKNHAWINTKEIPTYRIQLLIHGILSIMEKPYDPKYKYKADDLNSIGVLETKTVNYNKIIGIKVNTELAKRLEIIQPKC